jgi:hypothetical protein
MVLITIVGVTFTIVMTIVIFKPASYCTPLVNSDFIVVDKITKYEGKRTKQISGWQPGDVTLSAFL